MEILCAIFFGGAFGSLLRFILSQKTNQLLGPNFPYGILLVNVLGCLLVGLFSALLIERFNLPPVWRAGILIGFLGGFTTFSTFTLDTYNLFEQGARLAAFTNVSVTVILCLFATMLGVYLGRIL